MASRIRGAIACIALVSCALGCVKWRATSARTTELSRELSGESKPLDRLTVVGAVAASGQLLLEIRQMCSAQTTITVRHSVTERAGVGRLVVYLAVAGFLTGAVGGGLSAAGGSVLGVGAS